MQLILCLASVDRTWSVFSYRHLLIEFRTNRLILYSLPILNRCRNKDRFMVWHEVFIQWPVFNGWSAGYSCKLTREPSKAVSITSSCFHTDHEYFKIVGSRWVRATWLFAFGQMELEAHDITEVLFLKSFFSITLVAEHDHWCVL